MITPVVCLLAVITGESRFYATDLIS